MAEAMCHWRVNILDENKKLKLNNKILLNYKSVNKVYPSVKILILLLVLDYLFILIYKSYG